MLFAALGALICMLTCLRSSAPAYGIKRFALILREPVALTVLTGMICKYLLNGFHVEDPGRCVGENTPFMILQTMSCE
jgi:hypothetical protein